jgi:hypothetical protein
LIIKEKESKPIIYEDRPEIKRPSTSVAQDKPIKNLEIPIAT